MAIHTITKYGVSGVGTNKIKVKRDSTVIGVAGHGILVMENTEITEHEEIEILCTKDFIKDPGGYSYVGHFTYGFDNYYIFKSIAGVNIPRT